MNATMRFIVWGTIPIGQLIGGVLATTVSLRARDLGRRARRVLAVVPLLLSPVHSLKVMPEPVADGPGSGEPAPDEPIDETSDLPPDAPGVMQR